MILSQCRRLLDSLKELGLLTYRRLHTTGVPLRVGMGWQMRRNVEMIGMPDIQVYLPAGKLLNVELKASNGRQSPEQVEWQKELKQYGHEYVVVRGVIELCQVLKSHGVSHWSLGGEDANTSHAQASSNTQ